MCLCQGFASSPEMSSAHQQLQKMQFLVALYFRDEKYPGSLSFPSKYFARKKLHLKFALSRIIEKIRARDDIYTLFHAKMRGKGGRREISPI